MSVTAASIQLEAKEVSVAVNEAEGLPGVWFLTLSTIGGHVCIGGTLEELDALSDRIGRAVDEA